MKKKITGRRYQVAGVPGEYKFILLVERVAKQMNLPPREVYKIVGHYFRKALGIVTRCNGYVVVPGMGRIVPSPKAIEINRRYKIAKRRRTNAQNDDHNSKRFKNKRNRELFSEEYISILKLIQENETTKIIS